MQRTTTSVQIGDTRHRHTVHITSDPCTDEISKRTVLAELFALMGSRPMFFMCGLAVPSKLAIFHDGERWQLQAEGEEGPA